MDKKANDTFAFDLENRLDDFFNDSNSLPAQNDDPADDSAPPDAALPLKDLKSTVLAIDWEITDDALETFLYQVDGLVQQFGSDKIIRTFLKLLNSLGKYIRTHKSRAHPDTVKRIMAVYSALEDSMANPNLSQDAKEKRLLEEVREFRRLKAKIAETKSPYPASGSPKSGQAAEALDTPAIIQAISELKNILVSELSGIRDELKQLKKN
ncbi:MAG: hypothetical protein CR984_06130 [Proteobacteria bacterium]|nr:MAG: hypothetical protein CR984_06130 [Pseudomonadota bacterium]